jgi:hypothetical protein
MATTAEQWAELIVRVAEADAAGWSYRDIAERIIQPHPLHNPQGLVQATKRPAYRQLARRYILLGRWYRGAEPLPVEGVRLGGCRFRDPVEALRAHAGTLQQVWAAFERAWQRAWREAEIEDQ